MKNFKNFFLFFNFICLLVKGEDMINISKISEELTFKNTINEWEKNLGFILEDSFVYGVKKNLWYLKSEVYLMWNERNIYILIKVFDKSFYQKNNGEKIWDGDSIQIALEINGIWKEFAYALTPLGKECFYWQLMSGKVTHFKYLDKGYIEKIFFDVFKEQDTIIYKIIIPSKFFNLDSFKENMVLKFNMCIFDRNEYEPFLRWIEIRPGIIGDKTLEKFINLKLIDKNENNNFYIFSPRNKIKNFSFEYVLNKKIPFSEKCKNFINLRTYKNGICEISEKESFTGNKSIKMAIFSQPDGAEIDFGNIEGLEDNSFYQLYLWSKSTAITNAIFRVRIYTGERNYVFPIKFSTGWEVNFFKFFIPKDIHKIYLIVDLCNLHGEPLEVFVDNIILTKYDKEEKTGKEEIGLITDDLGLSIIEGLTKLFENNILLFENFNEVKKVEKNNYVVILKEPENHKNELNDFISKIQDKEKVVLMDIKTYATFKNYEVEEIKIENLDNLKKYTNEERNNYKEVISKIIYEIPTYGFNKSHYEYFNSKFSLTYEKIKKLEDSMREGKIDWSLLKMNNYVEDCIKEENEIIPLAIILKEDKITKGFPINSEIPWCGNKNNIYFQTTLKNSYSDIDILAISSINKKPLWIKDKIKNLTVYAIDVLSLDEPLLTWEKRGSYNKYIPVFNCLDKEGIKYGFYWNRRPELIEFQDKMKELSFLYPELKLTIEGYEGGYITYGWEIGNPYGKTYLFTGLVHHGSEWEAGVFGLYALAKYLGEHAKESPIKERLKKIKVKIIPIVNNSLYMAIKDGLKYVEQIQIERKEKKEETVICAIQMHHGVGPLQVGFGYSLNKGKEFVEKIKGNFEKTYINPSIYYDLYHPTKQGIPIKVGEECYFGPNPPSWDGYWNNPIQYKGLYNFSPEEVMKTSKLCVLSENSVYGRSPAIDVFFPVRSFSSLLISDLSTGINICTILTEIEGGEK